MRLLHDPENGPLPSGLNADRAIKVDFRNEPGGALGTRCGRCNQLVNTHIWQLIDDTQTDQGGVFNCGGWGW